MSDKPKRNELCPCGSGVKYKYCCISKKPREVKIQIGAVKETGALVYVDYTNDWLNRVAAMSIPMMNFCKDNDIYFFGMFIFMGEYEDLNEKLKKGTLKIEDIMDLYNKKFTKEVAFGLLESAVTEQEMFRKREKFLKDALEAHFEGKYTLSVPVFFAQLEGLLRDNGNIANRDSVKATIPTENWDERMAFHERDKAKYFNGFITRLFEGGKDSSEFNRNPVMHGFGLDYPTKEYSMILYMSILELRNFLWMDNAINKLISL